MSPYEKSNQKIAQKLMQSKQDLKDLKLYEYNQEELEDIKELNLKKKMKNKSPVFKTNVNLIDFQIKQLKQSKFSQLTSQSSNSPREDKSPRSATIAENHNFWQNYNQQKEQEKTENNDQIYDLRSEGIFSQKARKSSLSYSVIKYSDQTQVSVPMTGSFQILPDVNSAKFQFNVFINESPIKTKKFQQFLEAAKDVQNQDQNGILKSKHKSSNVSQTPQKKISPLMLPNIQLEKKESNKQDQFPTKSKSKFQYQIKGIKLQKNLQQQIVYQRQRNFKKQKQISTPLSMKKSDQKKERNKTCQLLNFESPTTKIFKDEDSQQK